MNLLSAPYRWIENIVYLREKHPYSLYVVLSIAAFVGIVRTILELMVCKPGLYMSFPGYMSYVTFYFQNAFLYTLALALLLPEVPWRKSINVVLVGVFVGIFPPLIDTLVLGPHKFIYSYIFSGMGGWNLSIYNPKRFITPGEAMTLWFTVLLVPVYVWVKSRSLLRTIAGFFIAYVVMFIYTVAVPTLAAWLLKTGFVPTLRMGELAITAPLKDSVVDLVQSGGDIKTILGKASTLDKMKFNYYELMVGLAGGLQIVTALICYLLLNIKLTLHLAKRALHSLPFAVLTLFGAVVTRTFFPDVDTGNLKGLIPAGAMALVIFHAFNTAIVQNDFYDRETDRRGSLEYIDTEDVAFFNVTMFLLAVSVFVVRPRVGELLFLFQIVSILYNYPFYKGKRYFPANYKIEGVWGWSSFMTGAFSVMHPRVQLPDTVLFASFLVFGGWSVFNYFKDYKDIREDSSAGVQTAYVLLRKRGVSLRKFHLIMRGIMAIGLLVPLVILYYLGAPPVSLFVMILLFNIPVFLTLGRGPVKSTVEITLFLLSSYFIGLCIIFEMLP